MRETYKDLTLLGRKWRVFKLNPLDGSNILRKFVGGDISEPQKILAQLDDKEYNALQKILLSCVYEIKEINGNEVPTVVISGDKMVVEFSGGHEVFMLVSIALVYNLQSFFQDDALKEFGQVVESFNVSNF